MEFFLKHKQLFLRVGGGILLLIGFVIYFWTVPQPKATQNELAAKNIARMEANIRGDGASSSPKPNSAPFLQELKEKQKKQLRYLTIIIMIIGASSLAWSFVKKKKDD